MAFQGRGQGEGSSKYSINVCTASSLFTTFVLAMNILFGCADDQLSTDS